VTIYLRAKVGFCNCTTGVADDEELERVGDVDLVGSQNSAFGPGRPITVHGMKGRSRSYAVGGLVPLAKSALSLAFNDRCDVIVATAVVESDRPRAQEPAVLEFLNGDRVRRWAESTLGFRCRCLPISENPQRPQSRNDQEKKCRSSRRRQCALRSFPTR
jgi:hypothetical protein